MVKSIPSRVPDRDWTLTPSARQRTEQLRKRLRDAGLRSDLYLTSAFCHAVETGKILRAEDNQIAIIAVPGLTPGTDESRFAMRAILDDAREQGAAVYHVKTLTLVGHEDRLSNLAKQITIVEINDRLQRLEALVLEVDSR
jgi:phosphohistidine phosphatase SixA